MSSISIHTADWVIPITAPPIKDGAVVVGEGRILQVGEYREICKQSSGTVCHHGKGAIMPALVNTHTHLELCALRDLGLKSEPFIDWLKDLVEKRLILSTQEVEEAIIFGIDRLKQTGTILVGDISNTGISIPLLDSNQIKATVFLEIIGAKAETAKAHWDRLASHLLSERANVSVTLAAHSLYSVYKEILRQVKNWGEVHKKTISIHLAESKEEMLFLQTGDGPLKDFLEDIGALDPHYIPPGLSPVASLAAMDFLDSRTLCVHLVHVSDEDIGVLKQKRAKACICPLSNAKLRVGIPPLDKLLKMGISVALGTDSLASNEDLNLFREMGYLRRKFPSVSAHQLLMMATIYGAEALGMDNILGSIEVDKEAHLIFIPLEVTSLPTRDVGEAIIESGIKQGVKWI